MNRQARVAGSQFNDAAGYESIASVEYAWCDYGNVTIAQAAERHAALTEHSVLFDVFGDVLEIDVRTENSSDPVRTIRVFRKTVYEAATLRGGV